VLGGVGLGWVKCGGDGKEGPGWGVLNKALAV
jgi:hypothetical protein